MKKAIAKFKWHIVIGITLLGGAISAVVYSNKEPDKKPESGVVVNGDTVAKVGTGDSIKIDTTKK